MYFEVAVRCEGLNWVLKLGYNHCRAFRTGRRPPRQHGTTICLRCLPIEDLVAPFEDETVRISSDEATFT